MSDDFPTLSEIGEQNIRSRYPTLMLEQKRIHVNRILRNCPNCGGVLKWGSTDPLEGDYYWCGKCGYGPVKYPIINR